MIVKANSFDRMWDECHADYLASMRAVGSSGWYILGRQVAAFEDDLAAYCQCKTAVGCANGMDAIEIALRVLEIGAGNKVLTTPLSAFATGLAILRAGAEPVYCDVDEHGLMDPGAAAEAFEAHPDISAIIPVHLYGHLADMEQLSTLAARKGVPLVEDAAQAIGARRNGLGVGGLGHISCYSFYPTKNLGAIGDGGALVLPDKQQADIARSLRNYGQSDRYLHSLIGLNSRLDEIHAATLKDVFLPKLDGWLTTRRNIAARYLREIWNEHVSLLTGPDSAGAGWHLFPVLVNREKRAAFLAHLEESGIMGGIHYPVLISHQEAMTNRGQPLIVGDLKTAQRFADSEVSLPIHPYLTDAEVEHVITSVNDWGG